MFAFKKNSTVFEYADSPAWIKRLVNGDFGLTDQEHATGVALSDGPYALTDSEDVAGLERVEVEQIDGKRVLDEYDEVVNILLGGTE